MNVKTPLAKKLIALRKEKNISQYEMAERLGIARSTYSGYESEGKQPDIQLLGRLALMLDTTADYLVGISSEPHPKDDVFTSDCIAYKTHRDALPPEAKKVADALFDDFYILVTRPMMDKRFDKLSIYAELLSQLRIGTAEMTLNASETRNINPESVAAFIRANNELKKALSDMVDKLVELELDNKQGE